MAKRRSTKQHEIDVSPSVTPQNGIKLITKQIESGEKLLLERPISAADFKSWETVTRDFLTKTFGSLSRNVSSVMDIGHYGSVYFDATEADWERGRADSLTEKLVVMRGLVELLNTEISLDTDNEMNVETESPPEGNRTFLVHGRNEGLKESAARFLEKLSIPVTILHEQPDQGRTLIEKFVGCSDVAFAVVLLTGDDRGGLSDSKREEQSPRARQNVIFELGFFIGKLGRKRVCALYEDGVEIPSDYKGVVFIPLDDNGMWKITLAREMKAAGLDIDMNDAI